MALPLEYQELIAAAVKLQGGVTSQSGTDYATLYLSRINTLVAGIYLEMKKGGRPGGNGGGGGAGSGGRTGMLRKILDATVGKSRIGAGALQRFDRVTGGFKRWGGMLKAGGRGMKRAGFKGGAKVMMGAGRGVAGAAAAAGATVAFVGAMVMAGKAMRDFAYEQENSNRRLAQISPSQAVAFAELDRGRMLRDLKTGENTAGTSRELNQAIDKFEEAMRPIKELAENVKNIAGAAFMEFLTGLFEPVNAIAAEVARWARNNNNASSEMFGDFAENIAREQERKANAARSRINAARGGG